VRHRGRHAARRAPFRGHPSSAWRRLASRRAGRTTTSDGEAAKRGNRAAASSLASWKRPAGTSTSTVEPVSLGRQDWRRGAPGCTRRVLRSRHPCALSGPELGRSRLRHCDANVRLARRESSRESDEPTASSSVTTVHAPRPTSPSHRGEGALTKSATLPLGVLAASIVSRERGGGAGLFEPLLAWRRRVVSAVAPDLGDARTEFAPEELHMSGGYLAVTVGVDPGSLAAGALDGRVEIGAVVRRVVSATVGDRHVVEALTQETLVRMAGAERKVLASDAGESRGDVVMRLGSSSGHAAPRVRVGGPPVAGRERQQDQTAPSRGDVTRRSHNAAQITCRFDRTRWTLMPWNRGAAPSDGAGRGCCRCVRHTNSSAQATPNRAGPTGRSRFRSDDVDRGDVAPGLRDDARDKSGEPEL
jgi:hypothetical protein